MAKKGYVHPLVKAVGKSPVGKSVLGGVAGAMIGTGGALRAVLGSSSKAGRGGKSGNLKVGK